MLSLVHVFTGFSPDASNMFRCLKVKQRTGRAKQQLSGHFLHSPRLLASLSGTPTVDAQQRRLQDAEDERWLDVEGGSPRKWRSCVGCAYLSAEDSPVCEACGMDAPTTMPSEEPGDVAIETSDDVQAFPPSMDHTCRADMNHRESLQEVVVAHDAPLAKDKDEVARHNVVLVVFQTLAGAGNELLARLDLHRFARLVAGHAHWDRYSRSKNVGDVASEYGWDVENGADLQHFRDCIDDEEGDWYCPTASLWALLASLDKVAGLLGERSHTRAALLLGQDPLPLAACRDSGRSVEDSADEGAEGDESESEGEPIPGTLDEAPPVGTGVKVLYDDDVWHAAQVIRVEGTVIEVMYAGGEHEEIDIAEHACRMADYESEDEYEEEEEEEQDEEDEQEDENSVCSENGACLLVGREEEEAAEEDKLSMIEEGEESEGEVQEEDEDEHEEADVVVRDGHDWEENDSDAEATRLGDEIHDSCFE